jgi:hypothetical protein
MTARVKVLKERLDRLHGPRLRVRQISHSRLEISVVDQNRNLIEFSAEQIEAMQRIGILSDQVTYGGNVCSATFPNELVDGM